MYLMGHLQDGEGDHLNWLHTTNYDFNVFKCLCFQTLYSIRNILTHHFGSNTKWHQNWDGFDQKSIHSLADQSIESADSDHQGVCLEIDLEFAAVFQTSDRQSGKKVSKRKLIVNSDFRHSSNLH